jgi:hypothetical protein
MYSGEIIGLIGAALPVAMAVGFILFGAHHPLTPIYMVLCFVYPLGLIALGAIGLWRWDTGRAMPWTNNLGIAFALFHCVLILMFVANNAI